MSAPAWRLQGQTARLKLARLEGSLHVQRPDLGLCDLRTGASRLPGAELLGLDLPSWRGTKSGAPLEICHRGPDLMAVYPESAEWPVRVEALWSAASPAQMPGVLATLDVIVSVRTELLDSWPELAVRSAVPALEAACLADPAEGRFDWCGEVPARGLSLDAAGGAGCFLLRLPDPALSYAEMVHARDSRRSQFRRSSGGAAAVEIRHRLFVERLEKGVILRSWVRGALVERTGDCRAAVACYAAFAAAEPPLSR